MSEPKLVSPLLDGLVMGNPIIDHDGIRCCPALKENTGEKYIVKIISIPASQVQLDALLLTGAYRDPAEAMDYFKEVAEGIAAEVEALNTLAKLEGFLSWEGCQILPMADGKLGYEVYLLSTYKRSLLRRMQKKPITYLEAVNLGLDLCAALAICRRAGYLYVDLKPSNIFLTREKQFRIGDLGLVKLDSLAHTSLPGKYRSPYVPGEVREDWKVLNETVDTYAVGMILYQIYNEGTLPAPPLEPTDPFPHPANADYEIASIIMKALDPDPAKRWADPMEMGQALVGYMQRNTVNNVPIVPPSGLFVSSDEPMTETPAPEQEPEETAADTYPQEEAAPEPPAEVPAPEPEEEEDEDFGFAFMAPLQETQESPPSAPVGKRPPVRKKPKVNFKGIFTLLVVLLILTGLGIGAFWYYQTQYLQTIDNLTLDGTPHELTVTVDTKMDPSLLRVTCTDAYGNSMAQPLVNHRAVFTDLQPDSLYRIELTVEGFHALTGKTAEIFSTDAMPTIVSLSAVTGPEDGSVLVSFTVDGADPEQWMVTCSAGGEEDVVEFFTGHTVTVKGLTVGKTYAITLGSANGDQVLGDTTVDFSATRLILPENLSIVDYANGVMTIGWDAPADVDVSTWNVRCYNEEGHEEVLAISGTEIAFTGIDSTKSYTVEVTAEGMTHSSRITVSANPLTITDFAVNDSTAGQLTVNWSYAGTAPEGGWLLLYTLDDSDDQNVVKCDGTSAVIKPAIPNANYHFTLQAVNATSVFGATHSFTTARGAVFDSQGMSAEHLTSQLLKTPDEGDWTAETVGDGAFTDTFHVGDSISVVLKSGDRFNLPEISLDILYVLRDGDGNVLSKYLASETRDWKALWYPDNYQNCELTLPKVPQVPGNYSVSIYFNNQAVTAANFTIIQ